MFYRTHGRLIWFFILLASLWSSIIFSQGSPFFGNVSYAFCGSIPDACQSLQWTGGDVGIVPYWQQPLIFAEIYNNPPEMPTAPAGTATGVPETSYSFSTSAVDPDGDPVKYTLDWGDGTQSVTGFLLSGAKAAANHTWSKAGTYHLKVFATDERGDSSGWSEPQNVIINSPPDNPSRPSGPISVYAWATYTYTSSASDPDADQVEYTFDWGDGNISRTDFIRSGRNANAVHSWSEEGDYRVRVIARDRAGAASKWSNNLTVTVNANNKPNEPRSLFGPSFGYTGIAHSYFTMAKDNDGDKVMYSFDWGDGASSTTDIVDSGSVECANHTWVKAGSYHIKANAVDRKGASSGWTDLFNVTIRDNDPPHEPIVPSGPTSGRSKWSEPLRVDKKLSNANSWREVHEENEAALRPGIQDISNSRT